MNNNEKTPSPGTWIPVTEDVLKAACVGKQSVNGIQQGGAKFDKDKPPMALLDADFLEEIARVLGFGAAKYAAHNWRNGIDHSRLISAAYRHLGAINRGENIDPESGLPHTGHLGCCVMFLDWMQKNRKDLDDRYIKQ